MTEAADSGSSHAWWVVWLAVTLCAIVFVIVAAEEPYHIDELRQTRYYASTFDEIVRQSALQEQPPLDALLNAGLQRVVGVGDLRQRLLPVLFGVGSLALLAGLMSRAGHRPLAISAGVLLMGLSPLLLEVIPYARPYALPLFLMLAFLLLADVWLAAGRWWALALLALVAAALPLSRTSEPLIFLACSAAAMGVLAWRRRELRRRALLAALVLALAVIVTIPVIATVTGQLDDRIVGPDAALDERLGRLTTDLMDVISRDVPYWPLMVVIAGFALALPDARLRTVRLWWWWVTVATALGFTLAFFSFAPLTQVYFARYLFTWIPPIAVLFAASITAVSRPDAGGAGTRALVIGLCALVGLWLAGSTWLEATRQQNADWQAASAAVSGLPVDTIVLYDRVRPLGSYRTPFAGHPRYTAAGFDAAFTLSVIRDPARAGDHEDTAVLLLRDGNAHTEVPGWTRSSIDGYFDLYLPDRPRPGREEMALAAEEFAEALGPDEGAVLKLTAGAIWLDLGNQSRARSLLDEVLADPSLREAALDAVQGTKLGELAAGVLTER